MTASYSYMFVRDRRPNISHDHRELTIWCGAPIDIPCSASPLLFARLHQARFAGPSLCPAQGAKFQVGAAGKPGTACSLESSARP